MISSLIRTFIRGQNVFMDNTTMKELEEKRKRHLEHQVDFILFLYFLLRSVILLEDFLNFMIGFGYHNRKICHN